MEAVGSLEIETKFVCISKAPAVERALPYKEELSNKWIAPALITVPLNTEFSPKVNSPLICQYTLHNDAELIKVTLAKVPVEKAPSILKINKASGSP